MPAGTYFWYLKEPALWLTRSTRPHEGTCLDLPPRCCDNPARVGPRHQLIPVLAMLVLSMQGQAGAEDPEVK